MTEHEKLKEICDEINYTGISQIAINAGAKNYPIKSIDNKINVREIIFTTEFMDKYIKYLQTKNHNILDILDKFYVILLKQYIDNPTEYLYNLLGLGTKD